MIACATLAELSVVVLSHNRREELLHNLQVLCELKALAGFELIVVDNASNDGTREQLALLQREYPDVVVMLSDENLGVARGRNLGWRATTRQLILNLDDDTRVDLDAMRAMCDAARSSHTAGIVTPRVVHAVTGECQNDYVGHVREPANFHGACHLVRKDVWERVGELDPRCGFGGEELDYAIRARAKGFCTVSLPEVTVRHNSLIRTGSTGRWRQEQWVYNYSRVLFKHFPLRRALVFTSRGLASHLVYGIRAHGPAVAAALIWNALKGAVDGRKRYAALPECALRFYLNSALLPDFGQVPLWRKLMARLTRAPRQGAATAP